MLAAGNSRELLNKRINACKERGFLPADLIHLVEKIYSAQLESREKAQVSSASTLGIADPLQHAQGAPLLPRNKFPYDRDQTVGLFHQFLELLAASTPALKEAASSIDRALKEPSLNLDEAIQAHLDGDESFFAKWSTVTPSAPRTLPMLVQAAMTPSLERCAELLGARTDLNKSWGHGHCPLCGSMPIMSDLREKEGFRYNICGFCHAEYRATRLQCPFCLETDTGRLEYYDSPEEPGLRVNACKTCKMYIKTTDFRNLDRRALPLVDDLESLRLDVLAREKKYKRPTLSAWGF